MGRFQEIGGVEADPFADRVDEDWLETEVLTFRPCPSLDESKRIALAMDYGMEAGVMRLPVRRAMRIYALRRLGFVAEPLEPPITNETQQLEWVGVEAECSMLDG